LSVPRITAAQFAQNLATDINQRDATVDTTLGPVVDIVIRPVSRVLEAQNERIRALFQLITLQNVNLLDPNDLAAYVYTEEVIPSGGTASFVSLTFSRAALPTVDITVPANFPVATVVDPSTGVQTTFVTLQSATLVAANAPAYFNGSTSRYELNITASSINSGQATAVGQNQVTVPLRPLVGFDSVTNPAISSGGLPAETNQQIATRYSLRTKGTEIGTPQGLSRYIFQTFGNVEDVFVVYGNNPFLTRAATDAGAVDIWVQGSSPVQLTMTVNFPGQLVLIPFSIQPGISVQTVQSGPTFTQNVDFVYVSDPGIYSGSTLGQDGIRFLGTGASPNVGDPLTITYTYDNLIVALQSFFQQPEYLETGSNRLFRRGIAVQVAITGILTVNAGNPTLVLQQVITALLNYINGSTTQAALGMGVAVEEFELDAVLSLIPGVGNFVYQLLAPVGQLGVADIPIGPNQYASLSSANLAITLA
jgi:hypothetical protein